MANQTQGKGRKPAARPSRAGGGSGPSGHTLLAAHRQVAREALRQLLKTPAATGLVVLVIAVAMLLPALLLLLTSNLEANIGQLESTAQITAYLNLETTDEKALEISERLQASDDTADVAYISPSAALTEFSQSSGLGATLESLERNPLPGALIITPDVSSAETALRIEQLLNTFSEVEIVQLDYLWFQRLEALLGLANQFGVVLLLLVAVGLIVIVGNVISAEVESRREEIRIIKQFGGTDRFVARPFLYSGLYLGAAGGLLACILLFLVTLSLREAVMNIAILYESSFQPRGLGLIQNLFLILIATSLGWISAAASVFRKIATIEP